MKKSALLISFLVLLIAAACAEVPEGNYYLIQADGPITPDACGQVGGGEYCVQYITPTPIITPTPEIFTPTPVPTVTPTPEEKCWGYVIDADWLRVRTAPWGAELGFLQRGDVIAPEAYQLDGDGKAWYKFWWDINGVYGYVASWYIQIGEGADCSTLPEEEVAFQTQRGFHVLWGPGSGEVLNHLDEIDVLKCVQHFEICLQAKVLKPELILIYRPLIIKYGERDCPFYEEWHDPSLYWDAVRDSLPDGFDYYELINECGGPPADMGGWSAWAWWSIEMAKRLAQYKNGAMLAFAFSLGYPPEIDAWNLFVPYFQWAEANPLPDGRYHGYSWHIPAYATWHRVDAPWISDPWLSGRNRMWNESILEHSNYDLKNSPIPSYITEVGVSDGYSGQDHVWGDFSCAEIGDAFKETIRQLSLDHVTGIAWWNIGKAGVWTSDDPCLSQMLD